MQKVRKYESSWHIDERIEEEIVDGWKVKSLAPFKDVLVVIFEKETRKDKLDHLNDIAES